MTDLTDRDIVAVIRAERESATRDLRAENARLLLALKKIEKYAEGGLGGSATYALDRLQRIRDVVRVFIRR